MFFIRWTFGFIFFSFKPVVKQYETDLMPCGSCWRSTLLENERQSSMELLIFFKLEGPEWEESEDPGLSTLSAEGFQICLICTLVRNKKLLKTRFFLH